MWLRQIDGQAASAKEVLKRREDPLWEALVPVTASMLHAATAEAPAASAASAAGEASRPPDRYRQDRPAQEMVGTAVLLVGGSRAITRVRVLGDVIMVKERDKHVEFTVDDGTGLLLCVLWRSDLAKQGFTQHGLQLGKLLHVGGPIRRYRGKVQLTAYFLAPETHVDGISLFWLQMINLHTNVYPCKSGADHVLTGAKRSRECAGQDKHVPVDSKEHHTHASCAASCSGLLGDDAVASKSATSTHTTSERSTRALKGCVAGGKQDSAFKAFDEELRRFVGTRRDDTLEIAGAGAGACEFESGREFVFSDLVRDSKVLDAARRALAAGTLSLNTRAGAGAGAGTGAGVGSGGVSYIHDSVPTRPCSSVTSTAPDLVGGTRWHAPAGRNSSTCALE